MTLNRNTWGDAFKIACGKLRILPSVTLSDEDLTREAKKLFPNHTVKAWNFLERRPECECPQITEDEIKTAVELLKIRKAPGPRWHTSRNNEAGCEIPKEGYNKDDKLSMANRRIPCAVEGGAFNHAGKTEEKPKRPSVVQTNMPLKQYE
jgi:hypothetical protein